MSEKLTLHIDRAEHFVLLEAILNWDTSNYVLKDKLEATRESLQAKLEDLGEEELECPCHCRDWVNIRYCNSIYPMCSNCHWCPELEEKIVKPDIIEAETNDEEFN